MNVTDEIMKLYLYGDVCKMIHYSTDKMHCHKLCDDVRDSINTFADNFAEQIFGYIGKPRFDEFSLKHSISFTNDISDICQQCIDIANGIRSMCERNKYNGLISLIDDFVGEQTQFVYLATFDKVSNKKIQECAKKVIKKYLINEGA